MIIISVAMMISWLIGSKEPENRITHIILISSFLCGLLYFLNIFKSRRVQPTTPNSYIFAEIILYIIYLGLASSALVIKSPVLILLSATAGLLLLGAIDNSAKIFFAGRIKSFFHSGQAFLTGLLIASFLSEMILPFLFIAAIKLLSGIYYGVKGKYQKIYISLRILRVLLLLTASVIIFMESINSDPLMISLFLTGELIDRILFYNDSYILHLESNNTLL